VLLAGQGRDSDAGDEEQDSDDLEGEVEAGRREGMVGALAAEEGQPHEVDVGEGVVCELVLDDGLVAEPFCGIPQGQRFGFGLGGLRQDAEELHDEEEGNGDRGHHRAWSRTAESFSLQVEQHDDEKEQHHDGARIDEDLDDADEIGVEPDEEGRQTDEGRHHGHGAGNRVAERDQRDGARHGEG